MTNVLGLDPSLTASGYTLPNGLCGVIRPPKCCNRGMPRLQKIRDKVLMYIREHNVDLVAIEGYSYGSRHSHAHSLGELGGVLRLALYEAGVAWVDIPPTVVKKYATGRGNATKELVLVNAIRRLDYSGSDNNEADAMWLWAIGNELSGHSVVDLPKDHLAALDKLNGGTDG